MAIENSVIFLPCRDIAATHDFYTRVVGLQKVQEQAGGTLHTTIPATGIGASASIRTTARCWAGRRGCACRSTVPTRPMWTASTPG